MSISSAIAAEYGERVRKEWVAKLRLAYIAKDWDAVAALLREMQAFQFSE
jgi:hypothetical protein